MTAGISAIATLSPIVASQLIFSTRRASKGFNALESDPMAAVMNFDIATAQCAKGTNVVIDVARTTSAELEQAAQGLDNVVKSVANSNKFARGFSKVVDFTANHINPVICATSAFNVLNSEDKVNTTAEEITNLGCMFGFEGAYKKFVGMPKYEKVNGKRVLVEQAKGLYEEIGWLKDGIESFTKYCNEKVLFNKLPLKFLPGTLKGLGFVFASIGGYNLGSNISKKLGFQEDSKMPELQTV